VLWLVRRLGRRVLRSPPAPFRVLVLSLAVLAYGTTGFLYFELPADPSLGWQEAIWYAVVTVTTVGYGDYYPATPGGRFLVAIPLMFFGIGLLGYVLSLAASALVEAKSKETHGMGQIKLRNHLLICNYPGLDTVLRLVKELQADGSFRDRDVVLIDEDLEELPLPLQQFRDPEVRFVRGNPAIGEVLAQANVQYARDAIVLSKNPGDPRADANNVVITLAIEDCSSSVRTVTQCVDPATREVLVRARCDGIVCTSQFDVLFLTQEILDPGTSAVVAELTSNLTGEQLYVTPYAGEKTVTFAKACTAWKERGHVAIGIRRANANHLNPGDGFEIAAGDEVISIGPSRMRAGTV
jgi:voltage-gated potassium channel